MKNGCSGVLPLQSRRFADVPVLSVLGTFLFQNNLCFLQEKVHLIHNAIELSVKQTVKVLSREIWKISPRIVHESSMNKSTIENSLRGSTGIGLGDNRFFRCRISYYCFDEIHKKTCQRRVLSEVNDCTRISQHLKFRWTNETR